MRHLEDRASYWKLWLRQAQQSVPRSCFLGCHATSPTLRDIPKNGCEGDLDQLYWRCQLQRRAAGHAKWGARNHVKGKESSKARGEDSRKGHGIKWSEGPGIVWEARAGSRQAGSVEYRKRQGVKRSVGASQTDTESLVSQAWDDCTCVSCGQVAVQVIPAILLW